MKIKSILIIEDSEAKLLNVQNAVMSVVPNCEIIIAKSVRSAITKIKSDLFDVIIADMSLPTYDVENRERGGTPRPFGGIEVFDNLKRMSRVVPVIVVTSYPVLIDGSTSTSITDLDVQLKSKYPDLYAGYVFFDSVYQTWERELTKQLKKISDE